MQTLTGTNFNFKGQTAFYKGKVRDVYSINHDKVVMIATDRISAFDVVLPKGIPYKGQVLNQIAHIFLDATKDIVPNWLLNSPHPMVSIGLKCEPIKVEIVVRGYLAGHAAREYVAGKRTLCGVSLPEGLKENDKLPEPIITPTTKADAGHDLDISKEEIIAQKIVPEDIYLKLEKIALQLFARGTQMAVDKGLILVDTKYEFGLYNQQIYLIDEIHTPDSSRYFISEGYEERQLKGEKQKQLSKEFVREWLIKNNFQGKEGQSIPEMTYSWVNEISERYIELYEKVTGLKFMKHQSQNLVQEIEESVNIALTTI
ncbi:MAG: phosphoribosylaminoimidazolesuccinocarboxamide synthase [Bacteroidia bacterium]|nr:phosphoribosylaminoimidazolesuccinocarboxamide synthase [Bacteroidia bacterium]MCZ2248836.1 phosphoribosylaminoimidazolesuccinocarboxamide synthase [Bacteroidia bacterium]